MRVKVAEQQVRTTRGSTVDITIYIDKEPNGKYRVEAFTGTGAKVNNYDTLYDIIVGALYEKSKTLEEYDKQQAPKSNRFEGIADDVD